MVANQMVAGLNPDSQDMTFAFTKLNAADFGVPQSRKRAFSLVLERSYVSYPWTEAVKLVRTELQQVTLYQIYHC